MDYLLWMFRENGYFSLTCRQVNLTEIWSLFCTKRIRKSTIFWSEIFACVTFKLTLNFDVWPTSSWCFFWNHAAGEHAHLNLPLTLVPGITAESCSWHVYNLELTRKKQFESGRRYSRGGDDSRKIWKGFVCLLCLGFDDYTGQVEVFYSSRKEIEATIEAIYNVAVPYRVECSDATTDERIFCSSVYLYLSNQYNVQRSPAKAMTGHIHYFKQQVAGILSYKIFTGNTPTAIYEHVGYKRALCGKMNSLYTLHYTIILPVTYFPELFSSFLFK